MVLFKVLTDLLRVPDRMRAWRKRSQEKVSRLVRLLHGILNIYQNLMGIQVILKVTQAVPEKGINKGIAFGVTRYIKAQTQ